MEETKRQEFLQKYGPWGVVAGASEGLGAAYAEALADRGLNLVIMARRLELLNQLASRLEKRYAVKVIASSIDLSRADSFERIRQATDPFQVGLLIYNAGFSVEGPFLDQAIDEHLEEVNTNVLAVLRLIYHFGGRMLQAGHGGMVLMTSLSAFQGSAYISNYSATKAYNLILAEGLWEEWRPAGVDVLACCAGAVRTPNYLSSRPRSAGRLSDATLEPEVVVNETLLALGRQAVVIPGRMNRISSFVMRRILPRRAAIRLMGSVLRKMYMPEPIERKGDL